MVTSPRFLLCAYNAEYTGLVLPVLKQASCTVDIACREDKYVSASFDPTRHIGLIILGSSKASADNEDEYGPEISWARSAIRSGRAVLGICHGAQLLAHVQGAKLHPWTSKSDSGLTRLTLTEDGVKDPVVRHVSLAQVPQWHCHTFDVPEGAVDLARSTNNKRSPSDAFRIGKAAYGLQFHPELTAEEFVQEKWSRRPVAAEVLAATEKTGRAVLGAWVKRALECHE